MGFVNTSWEQRCVTMLLVGLTGGIATGKSSVSQLLIKKGVSVVDADAVYAKLSKRVRC